MGRIEQGEQSEEVACPIDGHACKRDVIMGVVASLDMDAGIIFGAGLYSGKILDEVDRVGVSEQLRKGLDAFQVHDLHLSDGLD